MREVNWFGIRIKLLALLACLAIFSLATSAISIYGLSRIDTSSKIILDREGPLVRSVEEALFAISTGQSAAERILDLDSISQLSEEESLKATFNENKVLFSMMMAAITWGSETEAFRRSNNGDNYRAWISSGYAGHLVVQESPPDQAEQAGRTNVYFEGYVNNVERAIAERERYLALGAEKQTAEAEEARLASKEFQKKARRFAELTQEHLRAMIELSNTATAENAQQLRDTKENVRFFTLLASIIGLLVSIGVGLLFAERVVVRPIRKLADVAEAFGTGELAQRVSLSSRDELGLLGTAFNTMAGKIATYTGDLENTVASRTNELKGKVEELTERERELSAANKQLMALDKAKSEFISVAAHQLRTPLSAIKWVLGLLVDEHAGNLDSEQRSLLMKGFESNERMINLINEMLIVTRIESGKLKYDFVPTHVEDILESVMLDFSSQTYVRKIALTFDKPPSPLPYIKADSDKIRNVVQNLIENAVRYTPDGGSITLSAKQDADFIAVSVRDSGIGIPESQKASIFLKFFRADNAIKRQTDGSGLGLFIAKRYIEEHGGVLSFESAEGKGTTFTFTLPVFVEPGAKSA